MRGNGKIPLRQQHHPRPLLEFSFLDSSVADLALMSEDVTSPAGICSPSLEAPTSYTPFSLPTHTSRTPSCGVFLQRSAPGVLCVCGLWSVTRTTTVGPKWMWALSEEITTHLPVYECVCVVVVDWWGDTSTDGGFTCDERHGRTSYCPLASSSNDALVLLLLLLSFGQTSAAHGPHRCHLGLLVLVSRTVQSDTHTHTHTRAKFRWRGLLLKVTYLLRLVHF